MGETMKITFTDIHNADGVLEKPKPASEHIPQWYKDAKSYLDPSGKKAPSIDGSPASTIKRCMPVWDMMTAGYIMETPYDIYIRQTPEGPYFQWNREDAIVFQSVDQFQNHPYSRDINYAVRINIPWSITTPKGWSIMVMEPQHHELSPITCASGIVDTDTSSIPFNMFLKLRDPNFEGMIPAGTPFLQIIPFKRENWISSLGGKKERTKYALDVAKVKRLFFDRYKKYFWSKKEYK
jgi:hypothetical protein